MPLAFDPGPGRSAEDADACLVNGLLIASLHG